MKNNANRHKVLQRPGFLRITEGSNFKVELVVQPFRGGLKGGGGMGVYPPHLKSLGHNCCRYNKVLAGENNSYTVPFMLLALEFYKNLCRVVRAFSLTTLACIL